MRIDQLTRQDVARWAMEIEKTHAPRTVRSIVGLLHVLYQHAIFEHERQLGPGFANPAKLPPGILPAKRDAPGFDRSAHIFSREEAILLCTAEVIPTVVRVRNALALCTGARSAELSALRARNIVEAEPLRRIVYAEQYSRGKFVPDTKTGVVRYAPVHPELDRLLREWEVVYRFLFGERLVGDALIVPRLLARGDVPSRAPMSVDTYRYHVQRSLKLLGLRPRRAHDWRKTFLSIAESDGADPRSLRRITHTSRSDMLDLYVEKDWPDLCRAVSTLKVRFDSIL